MFGKLGRVFLAMVLGLFGWLQPARTAERSAQDKVQEIQARLLRTNPVYGPSNDLLDRSKLDYSLESLKVVDDFLVFSGQLVFQRNASGKLVHVDETALSNISLLLGTYFGEVLRKQSEGKLEWWSHQEWLSKNPEMVQIVGGKADVSNALILAQGKSLLLPLNKVGKMLQNGREDSLYAMAVVIKDRLAE